MVGGLGIGLVLEFWL